MTRTTLLEADTIIITIGQMSNLAFLKGTAVKVDERGRLEWNAEDPEAAALKTSLSQERS